MRGWGASAAAQLIARPRRRRASRARRAATAAQRWGADGGIGVSRLGVRTQHQRQLPTPGAQYWRECHTWKAKVRARPRESWRGDRTSHPMTDFAARWISPHGGCRRKVDVAETRPSLTHRSSEVVDTRLPSRIQKTVLRRPRCLTSGVQSRPSASGQALAMDLPLLMGLPHLIHQGIEQGIHQGIEQGIEAIANVADTVFERTSHNVCKSVPKVPCRSASGG